MNQWTFPFGLKAGVKRAVIKRGKGKVAKESDNGQYKTKGSCREHLQD